MKIIPYFLVEGKTYQFKRTRFLECEYEKISSNQDFTEEQQRLLADGTKLRTEYQELAEKFNEIKEKHFEDICNKEITEQYKAFKQEVSEAYKALTDFEIEHKDVSLSALQKIAVDKAETILLIALQEQYSMNEEEAKEIWCKHVDEIGTNNAAEWVLYMVDSLFNEEEESDPFLKAQREKAKMKSEQRKGLSKVKK